MAILSVHPLPSLPAVPPRALSVHLVPCNAQNVQISVLRTLLTHSIAIQRGGLCWGALKLDRCCPTVGALTDCGWPGLARHSWSFSSLPAMVRGIGSCLAPGHGLLLSPFLSPRSVSLSVSATRPIFPQQPLPLLPVNRSAPACCSPGDQCKTDLVSSLHTHGRRGWAFHFAPPPSFLWLFCRGPWRESSAPSPTMYAPPKFHLPCAPDDSRWLG